MEHIGTIVTYIIMAFLIVGMIGAVRNPDEGLGREFQEGVRQLGLIFIPQAGVLTLVPYINMLIQGPLAGFSRACGFDPAMWAGIIFPPDMGGNILGGEIAESPETYILTFLTSYIVGSGVTFGIPMSMVLIKRRDYNYCALGILSGMVAAPISVTIMALIVKFQHMLVRPEVSMTADANYAVNIPWSTFIINLLPVWIICGAIAVGVIIIPDKMIKGFLIFGKGMTKILYISFSLAVVDYFVGIGQKFSWWKLDPIIADINDINRALEVSGYISLMLAGAFPLLYILRTYCIKPIGKIGNKCGISSIGSIGIIGSLITLVAMFRLYDDMPPADKVRGLAFTLCAGYLLADHLVYTFNFQPTLYGPILIGKLAGGVFSLIFIHFFVVKIVKKYEQKDREEGIIGPDEYLAYEREVTA